jgi:hypothetical protein
MSGPDKIVRIELENRRIGRVEGIQMRGIFCGSAVIVLGSVLVFGASARAAFIGGVEDFNGTTVDDNTWTRFSYSGSTTVTDGYLDISGQNYLATKSLTVGVGDTIRARVMLTAASNDGTVLDFGLTSNPNAPFAGHQAYVTLLNSITGESDFIFFSGSPPSVSGAPHVMSDNIGKWYILQVRRTGTADYTSDLFADSGSSLFSLQYTQTGLPPRASVFIGVGPTARFDWVAVPEPNATGVLVGSGWLLLRRRKGSITPRRESPLRTGGMAY